MVAKWRYYFWHCIVDRQMGVNKIYFQKQTKSSAGLEWLFGKGLIPRYPCLRLNFPSFAGLRKLDAASWAYVKFLAWSGGGGHLANSTRMQVPKDNDAGSHGTSIDSMAGWQAGNVVIAKVVCRRSSLHLKMALGVAPRQLCKWACRLSLMSPLIRMVTLIYCFLRVSNSRHKAENTADCIRVFYERFKVKWSGRQSSICQIWRLECVGR
ncbi:hypothetical protein VFPPC_15835 [Pochonia chlamydosporia 170]|uniref:Uncharacterized protein n=1 Tax=Pochonia chlamydosporia 170 TaxID=1380566 RepID=A0A179FSB5_METCM|nr:hypothetical protein VFPPC_15835 [Pochonia chlamydosporia 170]OAQ68515.1 hypothetical protein VFPPC_15835 [Pochonia chlamydosporia 170]